MGQVVLKPMGKGHVPDVVAIERDLFDTPWTEGMFRQEVADRYLSHSWVAVLDDRVVGYMVTWFLRDQVHLLNIAVAREHQGRGHARRMLGALIEAAELGGRDVIKLEVRESNIAARRLYEAFDFATTERRKDYYQDDCEDAIVMTLSLNDQPQPGGGE